MIHSNIAICIPSYGLRSRKLLDSMFNDNKILCDKYDVILFLSNSDPKLNDYLDNYNNIHIEKCDANNIAEKREFIKNYCVNNDYKYMVMIDDDLETYVKKIDVTSKRTTSDSYRSYKTTYDELMQVFLNEFKNNNQLGLVTCKMATYIGFSEPGQRCVNKNLSVGWLYMYDVDVFRNNEDLKYDITYSIVEDVDMAIRVLRHGISCMSVCDYGFVTCAVDSSIHIDDVERNMKDIRTAAKYNLPIKINRYDNLQLKIPYEDFYAGNDVHEPKDTWEIALFEMLQKNPTYDDVKEFVKNKKKFKKKKLALFKMLQKNPTYDDVKEFVKNKKNFKNKKL